ncbi:hypothetical protein DPEC_G00211830 [Dallia pectoralis]|uniref:Uncharacterized protein n=1 Tax=Dallia pectoralis TaxID=75939 RepID=A0ACC2G6B4_DALPE|nr:hypothetical protein DPEC_G00211830 [Dallia pectoralis]
MPALDCSSALITNSSGGLFICPISVTYNGAVMWQRIVICCLLLTLCSAAPPAHINRLALFPDKSAWCEAKNITQIVGHTGCQPRSIQNRACLGQCFSYSVPNTFPQSTEALVHCDSCMPAQTQWEVVTLECPGSEAAPRVDKLVERIIHCSCQSCSKDGDVALQTVVENGCGLPGKISLTPLMYIYLILLPSAATKRMCGVDVDLDDGSSGDDEREDEFWVAEGVKLMHPPTAHSEGIAWGSLRGRCGCVACGAGLLLWNMGVALLCVLVLGGVFALVLLPASLLLYAGFLCHSRVLDSSSPVCRYLDDNSCSALIIIGFVMMSPLVVVAAAIFCGLLRRLRILLLFQPITHAWYRGRGLDFGGDIRAWV